MCSGYTKLYITIISSDSFKVAPSSGEADAQPFLNTEAELALSDTSIYFKACLPTKSQMNFVMLDSCIRIDTALNFLNKIGN